MAENIKTIPTNKCCGCRACGDACAPNAITFNLDGEGFFFPSVNEELCVSCGRCVSVCPVNKATFSDKQDTCFASFAKSSVDKEAGSSGGVFGILAKEAIKKGYVVYGAAFDEQMKLHHKMACDIDGLKHLLKSKYIQSNTKGIYKEIRSKLLQGEKVVFCGTPCQCAALKNSVGEKTENLLIVDFVCHGVPSQHLFDKTIAWYEKANHCKVKEFQFRYKGKGVKHPHSYRLIAQNEKGKSIERVGLHYQYPYYFAFQTHISLRKSCYECAFAKPERCSDITLGDFWGIEKYLKDLKAHDGVSMVVANTTKGEVWVNSLINAGLISSISVSYSFAIENNGCLSEPTAMPRSRAQFFSDLNDLDFDEVVQKHMKSKKQYVFDLYYATPTPIRKLVRKVMEKRMKYE